MTRYLFYDDDCGICRKFTDIIAPFRTTGKVIVRPYQELDEPFKRRYQLSDTDFEKGMYFLDGETGKISHGAFALNRFFLQFAGTRLLVWVLYIMPVLLLAEIILYNLVARHRGCISRKLGLTACTVNNPSSKES